MSRLTSGKAFGLNLLLVIIALFSIAMPQHSNAQQQQKTAVRRSTRSASAARQSRLRTQRKRAALARQRAARSQAQNAATSLNKVAPLNASSAPVLVEPSAAVTPNRRIALPAFAPLPVSVDPFAEIERAGEVGENYDIKFIRTKLDTRAAASAKVIQVGQTLLVRMKAEDMPLPSHFAVPRYALWVYVPNYQVKLYIGDLPITNNSKSNAGNSYYAGARVRRRIARGVSDSAYRYTVLPAGAEFGGLMLTAEPVRYTPIVNEALRPVLVGLVPKANPAAATAATAVYAGSMPVRGQSPPAPQ